LCNKNSTTGDKNDKDGHNSVYLDTLKQWRGPDFALFTKLKS